MENVCRVWQLRSRNKEKMDREGDKPKEEGAEYNKRRKQFDVFLGERLGVIRDGKWVMKVLVVAVN